jgi:hypothetical protein
MTAVALLRFEALSHRVHAAFADGRVPEELAINENFDRMLAAALQQPNDPELLSEEYVGYIEDVLQTREKCDFWFDDEADGFEVSPDEQLREDDDDDDIGIDPLSPTTSWRPIQEPVRNPLRHVGRNDRVPMRQREEIQEVLPDILMRSGMREPPTNDPQTQKARRGVPRRVLHYDHHEERILFLADLAATYSSKP